MIVLSVISICTNVSDTQHNEDYYAQLYSPPKDSLAKVKYDADYALRKAITSWNKTSNDIFKKTRFLGELPEVSWYYIDNYTIYIAFGRSVSGDNKLTCHSAALQGDLAVGGWGVRVYALNAGEYPSFQSLPRDFIPFYRVSYKNGELQKE